MRISDWSSDVCSSDLIGLGGGRRAKMHGFVRHQDMWRTRIRIRIDRHGLDAHLPRRADDAACNFATVRDQDLGDCHLYHCPSPYAAVRSEEHTSELQSLMRMSYAVFSLKKKNIK